MKHLLAITLLLLSSLGSGGAVLVQYTCTDSGQRGVAFGEDLACRQAACDEADQAREDCADDLCCDFDTRADYPADLRAIAPASEREGGLKDIDVAALDAHGAATSDASSDAGTPGDRGSPPPEQPGFAGFDRPLRI